MRNIFPVKNQFGFIQNIILGSLILLGVAVMGLNVLSERNQRGLSIAESTKTARAQLEIIRDALSACRVTWPAGNNGTGFHVMYPATPGVGSWGDVNALVCPGAGSNIWTAIKYSPPVAPRAVSAWQYQNTASGIFVKIESSEDDGNGVIAQVALRIPAAEKTVTSSSLIIKLMD